MPKVPKLVGQTVSFAQGLPIFESGYLLLTLMPPNAPTAAKIGAQSPDAGTYIDVGGTVTAMVTNQ